MPWVQWKWVDSTGCGSDSWSDQDDIVEVPEGTDSEIRHFIEDEYVGYGDKCLEGYRGVVFRPQPNYIPPTTTVRHEVQFPTGLRDVSGNTVWERLRQGVGSSLEEARECERIHHQTPYLKGRTRIVKITTTTTVKVIE